MNLDLTQGGALSPEHARQLDAIADEIRLPYQDMIAALGAAHTADMDWWVTPVASRNSVGHRGAQNRNDAHSSMVTAAVPST